MDVSAGEVAAGDTITTPPGMAALLAAAIVSPEQSGPTSATTFSALTMRSAALEAAVASAQVEIALHHDQLAATQYAALFIDLLDGELGAGVDRRHQTFDRPGEAAEEAKLDIGGLRGRRCRQHGDAGDRRGK